MNSGLQDLDLLVIFDALWQERSVSKAALRLKVSQPGLSHSLNRLRGQFHDELFVRSRQGVVPTPKAIAMQKDVQAFLEIAQRIHQGTEAELQKWSGRIRIATTDYFEHIALPQLMQKARREIPGMQIVCRPTQGVLPYSELERGEIDFAIAGFFGALPEGLLSQSIYDESYICITRKNHPLFAKGMSLNSYLKADHILVSPQGDLDGIVDTTLKKMRKERNVVAGFSAFHSVPFVVSQTDFIATFPKRMGVALSPIFGLDFYEPPIEVPGYTLKNVWHARSNSSAVHKWFRKSIKEILGLEKEKRK
jgi:DNA-binding transcriptional LysR family regulator